VSLLFDELLGREKTADMGEEDGDDLIGLTLKVLICSVHADAD
jgi:hypothetical protein